MSILSKVSMRGRKVMVDWKLTPVLLLQAITQVGHTVTTGASTTVAASAVTPAITTTVTTTTVSVGVAVRATVGVAVLMTTAGTEKWKVSISFMGHNSGDMKAQASSDEANKAQTTAQSGQNIHLRLDDIHTSRVSPKRAAEGQER